MAEVNTLEYILHEWELDELFKTFTGNIWNTSHNEFNVDDKIMAHTRYSLEITTVNLVHTT